MTYYYKCPKCKENIKPIKDARYKSVSYLRELHRTSVIRARNGMIDKIYALIREWEKERNLVDNYNVVLLKRRIKALHKRYLRG